jgi:hypothetical protein
MPSKTRIKTNLRTPWNRNAARRNPTPVVAADPGEQAKAALRQGGLEPDPKDPLRHVPLREPYGAKSQPHPAEAGTPATVTRRGPKRRRRKPH